VGKNETAHLFHSLSECSRGYDENNQSFHTQAGELGLDNGWDRAIWFGENNFTFQRGRPNGKLDAESFDEA